MAKKQTKKKKNGFWDWIFFIVIIILFIYFLFNIESIFNSNKIDDYQDCVEDCELEYQTCIYSLSVGDCTYYLDICEEDCESD